MRPRSLVPVLVFLFFIYPINIPGQMGNHGTGVGTLQVRVTDTSDRQIGTQAHVQLVLSGGGSPFAEGYTNNEGMVSFTSVPVGTYHLLVSGDGLENTDSGSIEVDERKSSQSFFVRVKRTSDSEAGSIGGGVIGVQDLHVPAAASKEFDAATAAMGQQDWKAATLHLNRAIEIYPKYAAAYNNLGTVYHRSGDQAGERQAFEKAISVDEHFAPALLNLGRLSIIEKKYSDAESLLSRASAADPASPQILMLLAQSELLAGHYDLAIGSKRKLHALPHHEQYALAHYIAARAFEHENRAKEAADELQVFLAEQPNGPLAQAVKKELLNLHGYIESSPRVNQ